MYYYKIFILHENKIYHAFMKLWNLWKLYIILDIQKTAVRNYEYITNLLYLDKSVNAGVFQTNPAF